MSVSRECNIAIISAVRHHFANIRLRLLLIAILAVLPMVGVSLYAGYEQRRQAIDRAQDNALSIARLAASDQEQLIEGTRQLLVAISRFPAVVNHDGEECHRFLADLIEGNPAYAGLGAAKPNGDVFCTAHYSSVKINCGDRPFFQRVLETKDFVLGKYTTMRISGEPGIAAVYPALDDTGEVRAVAFASIDLTWLDGFTAQAQLPEGSTISVIDQGGTILTRYPDPDNWRGQPLPGEQAQALLTQFEGLAESVGVDGVERLYAATHLSALAEGDLYVRVGIPKAVVLAGVKQTLTRSLIALSAATLLALALAGLVGHVAIMRPLNSIVEAVRRLDAGDLSARVGRLPQSRELDNVAHAIDHMAGTIESRDRELRRERTRAEALVSVAARLNSNLDLDHVLSTVCQEATRALQVGAACVCLYDEREGFLRLGAQCGLPGCMGEQILESWQATVPEPLKRGEPILVADISGPTGDQTESVATGRAAGVVLGTPMMHEERFIGVLWSCMPREGLAFTDDDSTLLRGICDQAAQAVENARLYQSLGQAQRRRAELVKGLISAHEDERRRIARDLHDDTSQSLSVLIMRLDAMSLALAAGEDDIGYQLQSIRSLAKTVLENTRRLISDLRPSLLDDLGLAPAIAWYAEQRLGALGMAVHLDCDVGEARLPPAVETALFRIAQEAITNSARHSRATRVGISLCAVDRAVLLEVWDNGQGFPVTGGGSPVSGQYGLGLLGIRERISILGGEVDITSAPGEGSVLVARVPLVEEG